MSDPSIAKIEVPVNVVQDFEDALNEEVADKLSPSIDPLANCRPMARSMTDSYRNVGPQEGDRVTALWGGIPNEFRIDDLGQVKRHPVGCPDSEVIFEGDASVFAKPEFGKALLLATNGNDVFMLVENIDKHLDGAYEIRRIASPYHRALTKPIHGICLQHSSEIDYYLVSDAPGPLEPEDIFVENGVVMGVYWSYSLQHYIDFPLQIREPYVSTAY